MGNNANKIPELNKAIIQQFWLGDICECDAIPNWPKYLWHYTSPDPALAILEPGGLSCGFAFTHYEFLNDNDEFKLGLDVAKRWMEENGSYIFPQGLRMRTFERLKEYEQRQCYVPYVLSFSAQRDSTELWMSYSDRVKGGYALGLDPVKIENLLQKQPCTYLYDGENKVKLSQYLFAPCIYCPKRKVMAAWGGGMRDRLSSVLRCLFSRYEQVHFEDFETLAGWCASRVFQFAALFKSDEYRFENEWRIIIKPLNEDYLQDVKFIGSKPRIVPVDIPMLSCLKQIVVSPHGEIRLLARMIDLAVHKSGCKLKVEKSKSSYNGR